MSPDNYKTLFFVTLTVALVFIAFFMVFIIAEAEEIDAYYDCKDYCFYRDMESAFDSLTWECWCFVEEDVY